MGTVEDDEVAELTTFQSKEAYVYAPLPPAPHYGHRAECVVGLSLNTAAVSTPSSLLRSESAMSEIQSPVRRLSADCKSSAVRLAVLARPACHPCVLGRICMRRCAPAKHLEG